MENFFTRSDLYKLMRQQNETFTAMYNKADRELIFYNSRLELFLTIGKLNNSVEAHEIIKRICCVLDADFSIRTKYYKNFYNIYLIEGPLFCDDCKFVSENIISLEQKEILIKSRLKNNLN